MAMPARAVELGFAAVPALRYRDLPSAIGWLCDTLGFERQLIVEDDDGSVRYAQLTLGGSMVMLVPVRDSAFDRLMVQPDEIGGAETQVCYFFVSDADAYCAQVKAAGVEIVLDLADKDHHGRGFSCRDPEGHLWNFGSYDPWRHRSMRQAGWRRPTALVALLGGLSLAVIISLAAAGWAYTAGRDAVPVLASQSLSNAGFAEEGRRGNETSAAELRAPVPEGGIFREGRQQSADGSGQESGDEQVAAEASAALAAAASAREAAERARRESLAELAREQSAKQAAEQALEEAHAKLTRERSQRQAAERAVRSLRLQLSRPREGDTGTYGEGITSLFEYWVQGNG
jgi:uncharacterized glyoxalase superfamily protein PhnB